MYTSCVKNSENFHLSSGQISKFLLVLLPINAGHSRKYNVFFYLPVRHWMRIYACPD